MELNYNRIKYQKIEIPANGMLDHIPEIPAEIYYARLSKLKKCLFEKNIDVAVVYADREHMQNFEYIFGIDIWFEEALGVIHTNGDCYLILGNECMPLAVYSKVPAQPIHCPVFSLPGQPQIGDDLKSALEKANIGPKSRIGCIGWKLFFEENKFDFPNYILNTLIEVTGNEKYLKNVTNIMNNPQDGLRNFVEAEQAAVYEFAATNVSNGMLDALDSIDENKTELSIAAYMNSRGLPLSCHTNVSSGIRTRTGLISPSSKRIKKGEPITLCWAMRGALSCRSGYVARSSEDLPSNVRDYMDKLVKPYFGAAVAWYQKIGINVTGGEMYDLIQTVFPKEQYGWFLNPGHNLAAEEWLNSSIFEGSTIPFRSGQMVQLDIIPAAQNGYASSNIEDGILIADTDLQNEISKKYPDMWKRIMKRKSFMKDVLGISLKNEILPLYDTQGILNPFMLNKKYALVIE